METKLLLILVCLTIAHLVGDFGHIGNPLHNRIQSAKVSFTNFKYFWIHGFFNGLAYGIVAICFLRFCPIVLGVIFIEAISHIIIDLGKSWIQTTENLTVKDYLFWLLFDYCLR